MTTENPTISNEKTRYRPRDRRAKPPKKYQPTQSQLEIAQWVYELRWATVAQLAQIVGRRLNTVQEHIRPLYDAGFVDRVPVQRVVSVAGGSPLMVYRLTKKGKRLLEIKYGLTDMVRLPTGGLSLTYGPHVLAVNDVRALIERSSRSLGWSIATWMYEQPFREKCDRVTIERPSKPTKRNPLPRTFTEVVPIVPDAYCVVQVPALGKAHFVIEVDRATERTRVFERKVAGYIQYIATKGFERRFGHSSFRVLVVVDAETEARFQSLLQVTEGIPQIGSRFWFARLADLTSENFFTEPVWTIAGKRRIEALQRVQ